MNALAVTECTGKRVQMIDITKISPNIRQPRKSFDDRELFSLADSIHRYGILQPLSVRRISDTGDYELVSGERRLRAASLLKMRYVPCIAVEADEMTSAAMAIIENIQRSDLNYFEEAEALQSLKEIYSMTQEQIAAVLSVSQSYVANKLRILRLEDKEREEILKNSLTERHCRALIRINGERARQDALRHIIRYSLNVGQTEAYIERLLSQRSIETKQRPRRLKDIRVFCNSIDRAVENVRRLGIDVRSEIRESKENTVISLIIPNN